MKPGVVKTEENWGWGGLVLITITNNLINTFLFKLFIRFFKIHIFILHYKKATTEFFFFLRSSRVGSISFLGGLLSSRTAVGPLVFLVAT